LKKRTFLAIDRFDINIKPPVMSFILIFVFGNFQLATIVQKMGGSSLKIIEITDLHEMNLKRFL
jgi:hypothetical protein